MKIKKINYNFTFLIALTLVVSISYGIGITHLSFYGDDWIYIYNYHLAGTKSFRLFTQWDRPYSAWVYILCSAVFKESALGWHIFILILRWLSAFLFERVLSDCFKNRKAVYAAALFFATYPGFQQQPIAVEFVMHFTSLVLVLLSIRLMQRAFFLPGAKMIPILLLSLAAGGIAIFTCEYFVGLELSRIFFLYFTVQNRQEKTIRELLSNKKFFLFLLPYGLVIVFFFIWRIFIFSFTTYAPKLLTALEENPLNGIRLLIEKVLQDIITVLGGAYRMIFTRPAGISLFSAIVIILILSIAIFSLFLLLRKSNNNDTISDSGKLLVLGIMVMMLSGIPFWGTFLDVSTEFPWDRSTLSFSPGAAIIIAALLDMAFKPLSFCLAVNLITVFSVLFQVQNNYIYIQEAEKMNDYFWQLAWRAPGLEKGTILASEDIPLDRTSDNDLSPVVNWQYVPENRGLHYDYKYFDLHLREGFYYTDPLVSTPVDHTYRTHAFSSSTEKTLGIFYKKNGCLQIIDRSNTDYPDLPESLIHISGLSDIRLIRSESTVPALPPKAIGDEPDHGYCYYFQKTTLAQQNGDLGSALDFASQALLENLHPTYASDLAPLVLAFLQASDFENAEAMLSANQIGSDDRSYLCKYWINHLSSERSDTALKEFLENQGCF